MKDETQGRQEWSFRAIDKFGDVAWAYALIIVFMATAGVIVGVTYLTSKDLYKFLTTLTIRNRPNPLVLIPAIAIGVCCVIPFMKHMVKPIHICAEGDCVSITHGKKAFDFQLSQIRKVKFKTSGESPTYRVLRIKLDKGEVYIAVRNLSGAKVGSEDREQIESFYHFIRTEWLSNTH